MGIVAAIAFLVVLSNLLADIVYAILDPRITYS
jgi:ABC-type dipeptide/oligopeptide/nickel transport system permease component